SELAAALEDTHHFSALHAQAALAITGLEQRLGEVLDSNHQWFVRAGALERQVAAFEASRSWRLTAPLRALRRGSVTGTKQLLRVPMLATMRTLARHPRLWQAV